MKRIIFLIIIILSLVMSYCILSIWRGVSLYSTHLSEENLLKAHRINPSNPDPFYRLALFYYWDIQSLDLKKSANYLMEALRRNPLEQEYWIHLTRIFQRMGERKASEQCLETAIEVFPSGYRGRWTAANLFLQQGELEKALIHFNYILTHYPNQSHLVYEVLKKLISNSDFILERVVPRDPLSFRQYLSFLYEAGDDDAAQKAWKKKDSFSYQPDRKGTLQHIEFLISRGDLHEAFRIWKARLQEEGLANGSEEELITNGGFEEEKILGGGFDWRIEKVPGVEISFDSTVAFEGKRSLRIIFNGKENVDFRHVYQFVSLRPSTEYLLKGTVKTKEVTTKSGLKIELLGIGGAFYHSSETMIGDHDWKEFVIPFKTPPQSKGGLVRVRRERTEKFDRFISGTAWIDGLSLREVSPVRRAPSFMQRNGPLGALNSLKRLFYNDEGLL